MNATRATFWNRAFIAFALVLLVLNGVYPMIWIILTSFKTEIELQQTPITYLPKAPSFTSYVQVFEQQPFAQYFLNSVLVASLSTIICVVIAALAGYAIARVNLPFKRFISIAVVAAGIFPVVSLIVPLYQMMLALGWLNTYLALVIPYAAFSLPISILTLAAFFQGIPKELEDAAMVDGCSRLGALWRIIVPLSAPGMATAAILAFVNSWNEFLLALTFASNQATRTVPPAVALYQGEFSFPWPVISAAITIAIIPIVVMILIFQQRIISGLTAGSVKG
jgi:multiple sugar transport system permease protein